MYTTYSVSVLSENQIVFYNHLGQVMDVPITNTNNLSIADMNNIDNGIYFIKINGKIHQITIIIRR